MASSAALSAFLEREAIIATITRGVLACDRHDTAMFNSAFVGEDVSFEIDDGTPTKTVMPSLSLIRTHVLDNVGPMDTTHTVSNFQVDIKDDDTAIVTATSLAQHCPPGRGKEPDGPKYLVGGEYSINMVKVGEKREWKAKKWGLKIVWTQGNPLVMKGAA
jgi:hypothetical protein